MFDLEISDQVATITLRHPPVNALSRAWAEAFHTLLDQLDRSSGWRILCIRSTLKLFSAGGDIKEFAARLTEPNAGDLLAEEAHVYQGLFDRIERMPQISIALVQGVAAGGGFELALACDMRIAGTRSRLGLPEVGLGLLPSAGGTQRMTRLVGRGRALRLIGGAELVSADDALALGLVEWVVPDDQFEAAAGTIVRRYVDRPYEALQAAKDCISAVGDPDKDGSALEVEAPRRLMQSSETRRKLNDFIAESERKKTQ